MKKKIITTLSIIVILCTLFFGWFYLSKAHIIPNYFGFMSLEAARKEKPDFGQELSCVIRGKEITRHCITLIEFDRFPKKSCGDWECTKKNAPMIDAKPVIYLYPPVEQEIQVRLQYQGEIFAHYPDYDEKIEGWKVIAKPDGTLMNLSDNKEYSYLFWEGKPEAPVDYDLSKGFVVKGSDTKVFLQQKLAEIGLTPKEYNEFIVYWFPKMQDNPYNLIHFAQEQYTDTAPLSTIPKSDSMLRVFMVFKKLEQPIQIESQIFVPFERNGLTVVEWGGGEIQ